MSVPTIGVRICRHEGTACLVNFRNADEPYANVRGELIEWCDEIVILEEETEGIGFILGQRNPSTLLKIPVYFVDVCTQQNGAIASNRPRRRAEATDDGAAAVGQCVARVRFK